MRKLLLVLTLLLSISTYVAAQNYTEVVYLKNGSIIKGVIIEQVPNVSLKIKTSDGSLIICQMITYGFHYGHHYLTVCHVHLAAIGLHEKFLLSVYRF
mgnify:CR=1 FL=1